MVTTDGNGCPRCAELERKLLDLMQRIAKLEAELAAARKNSSNSSKPPSSDIVKPKPKGTRPGRRKRRGAGGKPGHPRHERPLFEEQDLDQIWEWRYSACPCCQGQLMDLNAEPARKLQQIELPQRPVLLEEHRAIGQWCR